MLLPADVGLANVLLLAYFITCVLITHSSTEVGSVSEMATLERPRTGSFESGSPSEPRRQPSVVPSTEIA